MRFYRILIVSLITLWAPIFAQTPTNIPRVFAEHNQSIWDQFYTTIGWHNGGRQVGFFLPRVWHNPNSQIWWDTGLLLKGSGIGYRTMLNSNYFFVGCYGYYDVMSDGINLNELLTPLRLNVGAEVSSANLGILTLNAYGICLDTALPKRAYDIGGISAKASWDRWTSIKPFVAASYSWVKFKPDTATNILPSVAAGAQFIIDAACNIEVKVIKDQYQSSLHVGFQIKQDGMNPKSNYFKHRLNSPPDRYIPYYANSMKLEETSIKRPAVVPDWRVTMYRSWILTTLY